MEPEFDISPERAIERLVASAPRMSSEEVRLALSAGRVLAHDVSSRVDRPTADDSALDGFVCYVVDTLGASPSNPVSLELVGEVAAGRPFNGELGPGQAVRIATGGLLPPRTAPHRSATDGVLGVIGVEHAHVDETGRVVLERPADAAAVRPRGQDLRGGERYLLAGTLLDSAGVGLAAAMGHASLAVARRPRLLLVSTGDELLKPGEQAAPGRLFDANGVALAAMAARAGCEVSEPLHVEDELAALKEALFERCTSATPPDLIVTSGGVSRGERDVVRDLMLGHGELVFWRVSVRPAGPTMFGRFEGVPLLGLPGNPVSSLVGFLLFGRALIDTALRRSDPLPYYGRVPVRLTGSFRPQAKTVLHRARLEQSDDGLTAHPFENQSSGVLRSLVAADALVVIPPRNGDPIGDPTGDPAGTESHTPERAWAIPLRPHL